MKEIAFEKVHTFPYSERNGTAASRKGDSVPKAEKERRAAIMISETEKIRQSYLKNLVGKSKEVLFENMVGENTYQGYTKSYIPVQIKSSENIIGKTLNVKITDYNSDYCIAE